MTELKTLKDFADGVPEQFKADLMIKASDLKAEAVKWIKYILETELPCQRIGQRGTYLTTEDNELIRENIVIWIKHFFNITDTELK